MSTIAKDCKPLFIDLFTTGNVSIGVIDHLIVSHNHHNNLSTIYDIQSDPDEDTIDCLVSPLQMSYSTPDSQGFQMIRQYTDCKFFYPNVVINIASGRIYTSHLNIEALCESFCMSEKLISMLIRRNDSKNLITNYLNKMTKERSFMSDFATAFNTINEPLAIYEEEQDKKNPLKALTMKRNGSLTNVRNNQGNEEESDTIINKKPSTREKISQYFGMLKKRWRGQEEEEIPKDMLIMSSDEFLESRKVKELIIKDGRIVITQHDIYQRVFAFMEETMEDHVYVVAIVSEYIRSLNFLNIQVESFIYEVIVNVLVRNKQFFKLHQLLQYHVIADSVHIACQLLHIGSMYKPAIQLSIDMLKRLNDPSKIIEVLFSKG